jgi:hypothetical protein
MKKLHSPYHPEESIAFDEEEFTMTFLTALEFSQNPSAVLPKPSDFQVLPGIQFLDHPMTHFAFAARRRYSHDPKKFSSFMWRFFAVQKLIADGCLVPKWMRTTPEATNSGCFELGQSVLRLAARHPLTKEGRFDQRKFLAKLERRTSGLT